MHCMPVANQSMLAVINHCHSEFISGNIKTNELTLKWKCCHFHEIFVTGCTGSCHLTVINHCHWIYCWKHKNYFKFCIISSLKWKCFHFHLIFITGCTGSCPLTTCSVASDENLVKIRTFSFQCRHHDCIDHWNPSWMYDKEPLKPRSQNHFWNIICDQWDNWSQEISYITWIYLSFW